MSTKAKLLKILGVICAILCVLEIVLLAVGYQPVNIKNAGTAILAALGTIVFFVIAKSS